MATYTGIGYSQNQNWQEAAFEASLMARKQLGSNSADVIVLLTTSAYTHPDVISSVRSVISSTHLIGSSTSGIIVADRVLHYGLALLAIKSDSTSFSCHSYPFAANTHLRTAGFDFTHGLNKDPHQQRQGYLIFGDGFNRHSSDFLLGVGEDAGFSSPFIGGISSIGPGARRPCQYYQQQLLENHAVGLMFSGPNRCYLDTRHPYKVLGKPRLATKVTDTVLRSIGDKPAVHIYEEFLKETAEAICNDPLKPYQLYPLSFYDETSHRYMIRNPIDILADGSIVFQADIPQGAPLHVMITNKELCVQSAFDGAKSLKDILGTRKIELLFILASSSRARILGRNASKELMILREVLGFQAPVFGLYTDGEIAPWPNQDGGKSLALNNNSLMMMAIT